MAMIEPYFHLPSCYNVQPPPPAQTKAVNFSDETLFFIFYSTPRDVLQEVAALELHRRNWRFHKELQLWLTKEPSMEPTQKTPMFEKGQYMFWDVESWQRVTKNFVLLYELLEDRPGQGAALQEVLQQQQQQHQAQQHQAQQQQQHQQQQATTPITPGGGGNGEVTASGR
jgi:CCR4-NOT transcription complex subunit 2